MRRFVTAFYRSLYDVSWLKVQRFASASAWSYFALFTVLVALVGFTPIAIELPTMARGIGKTFVANIPEFSATIKNNKLEVTNIVQPFRYLDKTTNFLFYVDTVNTSSLLAKDFATGTVDAVILFTTNNIQMYTVESDVAQTMTLDGIGDGTITKAQIIEKIDQLLKPQSMIIIDGLLMIIFYLSFFLSELYVIFLVSVIVMFVGRMKGLTWKFREYFTIGLYAITLPSILSVVISFVGLQIKYLQFIAMLAFVIALVWSQEKEVIIKK
jgi:hypothetical protein